MGYQYPAADAPTVSGVSFDVGQGELVLLVGPTGCGKSTLLRLIAGLAQRHGEGVVTGHVNVEGHTPATTAPAVRTTLLGLVSQQPHDQLITGTISDELTFSMASAGHSAADMNEAIPSLMDTVGLSCSPQRSPHTLSGGQVQRLVTGAALAAGAGLLLLDEPLAHLDPVGAQALLRHLDHLRAQGLSIVMVEHRLEDALSIASRLLVMDGGRIVADAAVSTLVPGAPLTALVRSLGLTLPGMLDLRDRLHPRTLDTFQWLPVAEAKSATGAPIWHGEHIAFRYPNTTEDALNVDQLTIHAGQRIAIVGANGAGKSTLLTSIHRHASTMAPCRTVPVPQNPDLALFCASVNEELAFGPRELGCSEDVITERVAHAAQALSVDALLARSPQSLSRGQRLRTAIAAVLSCEPDIMMLDEPTAGQDHRQIEHMMSVLQAELANGALLFATHDIDLALRHANRVLLIDEGRIIADGSPETVLGNLPPHLPIQLPPVYRFCQQHGLPPMAPDRLADVAQPLPQEPMSQTVAQPFTLPPLPDTTAPAQTSVPHTPPANPSRLDPRTALVLLATAGVLAVSLDSPWSLGIFVGLCSAPLLFQPIGIRWWQRGGVAVAGIVWGTVLSQGMFYAQQPRISLAHIGPLHIYQEGLLHGLEQSLRFVGLALGGIALTLSTAPDRLFVALTRLRIPFALALMAATALRFLPLLGAEMLMVRHARAVRGRPVWRRNPVAVLWMELSLLRPVVARTWRRAHNLAEALDSRGFDTETPRSEREVLVLRRWDWALMTLAIWVGVSVASARLLYVLYTTETLYVPSLRPVYGFVRAWL